MDTADPGQSDLRINTWNTDWTPPASIAAGYYTHTARMLLPLISYFSQVPSSPPLTQTLQAHVREG